MIDKEISEVSVPPNKRDTGTASSLESFSIIAADGNFVPVSISDKCFCEIPILFESSKDLYYRIRVNKLIDELDPSEAYFALCEYLDYKDGKVLSNLEKYKRK